LVVRYEKPTLAERGFDKNLAHQSSAHCGEHRQAAGSGAGGRERLANIAKL
jgi:hypothetical protein